MKFSDSTALRGFKCNACSGKFWAKVGPHEAGICPKCKDTEDVERLEEPVVSWDKSWSD